MDPGAIGRKFLLQNSNRVARVKISANKEVTIPVQYYSSALVLGTANSNVRGLYLISRKPTEVYTTPLTESSKADDFEVTILDSNNIIIKTGNNTEIKVLY